MARSRHEQRPAVGRDPRRAAAWVPAALALATLAVAGCTSSQVTGPVVPAETALPSNYTVEYDPLLGTPRYVANRDAAGFFQPGAPAPFTEATAFQIVHGFVTRYATVFHLRPGVDDFVSVWTGGGDGMNIVKVQQTYRGVPVDVMGYGTTVLANREVGSIIGRFMPDLSLSVIPALPPADATKRAIHALTPRVVHAMSAPVLTIITDGPTPRLTWWVIVIEDRPYPLSWTVMLDARDGAVIHVRQNWIDG